MRCNLTAFFTRRQAAEHLGVSVNVITNAVSVGQLKPEFKQGGRSFYTKKALDSYCINYRTRQSPPGMLNFREAAEYLNTTQGYLHRLVYLNKITPDIRSGARKYFYRETLDAFLADKEKTPTSREIPEGYITTADLLEECRRLNKQGHKKPRSHGNLSRYLKKKEVPYICICSSAGPGFLYAWMESAAWDALQDYIPRSAPDENHIIAPPEILNSRKWVTCRRAAELIGCTPEEISSRAVKYSFVSYLHPKTKRLLVNFLQVREAMYWRKPAFIIKHLGRCGYELVKRTCEKKRLISEFGGGVWYRVPELISAERKGI